MDNDPVRFIRLFVEVQILIVLALFPALTATALHAPILPAQTQLVQGPDDPVDINTATIDQLLKVPGLTRTWAARIMRFRPYRAKNELLDRGILNSQVYDRIKDHIVAHRPAQ